MLKKIQKGSKKYNPQWVKRGAWESDHNDRKGGMILEYKISKKSEKRDRKRVNKLENFIVK